MLWKKKKSRNQERLLVNLLNKNKRKKSWNNSAYLVYLPGVLENYSNVNKSGNVAQKSFSTGKIGARTHPSSGSSLRTVWAALSWGKEQRCQEPLGGLVCLSQFAADIDRVQSFMWRKAVNAEPGSWGVSGVYRHSPHQGGPEENKVYRRAALGGKLYDFWSRCWYSVLKVLYYG